VPVLAIDHLNVGPYVRNTMLIDKCDTREERIDRHLPRHAPGRTADG
jgi:hypothetical protein